MRRLVSLVACAVGLLLAPASAFADHHEMLVTQVFPGSTAHPNEDFVELQMYAGGQGFVSGHSITIYDASGTLVDTATFSSNVASGQSQRTVLAGASASVFGVTPDLVDSGLTNIAGTGGAVCWNTSPVSFTDCVSWGGFSGSLPDSAGTPQAAIGDGNGLRRAIDPGCSTLLEPSDDTDDSASDFVITALPDPRNNAVTPTEVACPNTSITSGPSGKTRNRRPTFRLKSAPTGADFLCKLDDGPLISCTSPDRLPKLSFGKHKFAVRAVDGPATDPTPAVAKFKVVKKR